MNEHFSSDTKALIARAREVAIELRTAYVSTFHFFLADCLIGGNPSILRFVFNDEEDFKKYYTAQKAIRAFSIHQYDPISALPLLEEAQHAINRCLEEKNKHDQPEVMPFHILLSAAALNYSEMTAVLVPQENLYPKLIKYYTKTGLLPEEKTSNRFFGLLNPFTKKEPDDKMAITFLVRSTREIPAPPIAPPVAHDNIEVEITGLSSSKTKDSFAILFTEKGGQRKIAAVIGAFEAQSLAIVLEKKVPYLPLTHNLLQQTISTLGYIIKESVIHSLKDQIFHASIVLTNMENTIELDARLSDAVTMALLYNKPIYFNKEVFEAASFKE